VANDDSDNKASDDRKLDVHLFICTNEREKGESCGEKGSCELRDEVKKRCKKALKGTDVRIRVNASGCLGHCSEGIAAVLYPRGEWKVNLTEKSADELEKWVIDAVNSSKRE